MNITEQQADSILSAFSRLNSESLVTESEYQLILDIGEAFPKLKEEHRLLIKDSQDMLEYYRKKRCQQQSDATAAGEKP